MKTDGAELLFLGDLDHFAAFVAAAVRAGAMRQFGLVAIRALGDARDSQRIVGPAGGSAPLGVSSFRIWHLNSLYAQFFQRRPTVVHCLYFTAAPDEVAVLPANRTDALAILAAYALHRHREQNVLPQNIFQLQTASLVERDLRFALVDLHFVLPRRRCILGPVEQIEIGVDRKPCGFQAPVAIRLDGHVEVTLHSNLSKRVTEEFRRALRVQGCGLSEPLVEILDLARGEGYVKPNLLYF